MRNKFLFALSGFLLLLVFSGDAFSQTNCAGGKMFTEKKCAGDDLTAQEKELFTIVNDYRAKNNLPPVALSSALSALANRHLLDLLNNIKSLSHGWSNCPYDIKNEGTWNCLFDAPKRLNVGYSGAGFENLYRNNSGFATPSLALEAWKKSELHNSLILNSNMWKDVKFDAFGVAISGNYAALWFGSTEAFSGGAKVQKKQEGLGVSFDEAVAGLTNSISIKKASSNVENEEWSGTSADKSLTLSLVGAKEDISRAELSVKIKLEKDARISEKNKEILKTFLGNLAPEWKDALAWVDASIKKIQADPSATPTVTQGNKTFSMPHVFDSKSKYVSITVKPKRAAIEFK